MIGKHLRVLGSIPDQSVWDFWWVTWHWNRFISQHLRHLSVSIIRPMLNIH